MTEVPRYWTNLKELELAAAALAEEVAAEVAAVAAVAEALEGVDHPVWEDCSRLECPS